MLISKLPKYVLFTISLISVCLISVFYFLLVFYWDYIKIHFSSSYTKYRFVKTFGSQITPVYFRATDNREFQLAYDRDSIWFVHDNYLKVIALEGVDVETFEFINKIKCVECYAKDKNGVYYIMGSMDGNLPENHPAVLFPEYKKNRQHAFLVKNADLDTFKDLGSGNGSDKNSKFLYGINLK